MSENKVIAEHKVALWSPRFERWYGREAGAFVSLEPEYLVTLVNGNPGPDFQTAMSATKLDPHVTGFSYDVISLPSTQDLMDEAFRDKNPHLIHRWSGPESRRFLEMARGHTYAVRVDRNDPEKLIEMCEIIGTDPNKAFWKKYYIGFNDPTAAVLLTAINIPVLKVKEEIKLSFHLS